MIAEAVDTLRLLILAAGIWFIAASIAVGLTLAVLLVGLYGAVRAVWRLALPARRPRPSWARGRRASRSYARPLPDYDEAA
ncbi:hypothetical protein [Streptomyces sp. OM5714]|uniref:hypothetical protein n=1 Tax=Streptomyces sp. OM5714 TaxID=2602736 RepID=UPI0013D9F781|nr:hypothetical protein [Streptomyces sp. OM5714]KAF2774661.1 hypothetical protein STPH1_7706 [Streptomyces sp. OM5714]